MSSSAIPGVMETIHFEGDVLVDGGVAFNMDVITGIQTCLAETNGDQSQVVVDMISCNPHTIEVDQEDLKTLDVFSRARSIRSFAHGVKYALWAMEEYPDINYRYYIQPSQALPGKIPLDFKPVSIQKSFDIGHGDAQYVVANNIYARDVIHQLTQTLETVHVA
jgi:predicted patatin/cPLA2 family phospholipase